MKKRIAVVWCSVFLMVILMGCGKKELSNDYIKIKNYKGIEITKQEAIDISDEMVEQEILAASGFEQDIYTETKRTKVKDGDKVVIDLEGKKDGEPFQGGTETDVSVTIGSNTFVKGFEEQMIDHSIGETFDIEVTFPEGYERDPSLAGQLVSFTVTIKSIREIDTKMDEMKKEMKKRLTVEGERAQKQNQFAEIQAHLLEQTEIIKEPKDEELIDLILELVAEKENLTISSKELEKKVNQYAVDMGYENKEKMLTVGVDEKVLKKEFQTEAIMEWLLKQAKEVS